MYVGNRSLFTPACHDPPEARLVTVHTGHLLVVKWSRCRAGESVELGVIYGRLDLSMLFSSHRHYNMKLLFTISGSSIHAHNINISVLEIDRVY